MANPIKYQDLFEGVDEGLGGLISKVSEVESSLLSMIKEVKKEASALGDALASTSPSSKEGRESTSQLAAEIERLTKANEELDKALKKTQKDLDALKGKSNDNNTTTKTLAESYAFLSDLINETNVDLTKLITTEKQINTVKKNEEAANNGLVGSYNRLYAQYNLIKNALNAMGRETEEEIAIAKKWEAEALRLMNQMKDMQEATGKHTLSVGDYGKALNGLSISTQQVLREMPTLANSLQQFFIAISNNVPIFVDNLKAVQKETGSWAIAMKGVLTSLFSWQTALLVVLTILPKLAKAIHDKKKAQDEDNSSTKKAISLLNLFHEAMVAVVKAEAEDAAKLTTLVHISQDYNRTQEDRIKAATILKGVYAEQLSNYTAEEIALGKAKVALDNITESIKQQAKARALLNKITEAYIGQIDAEDKALEAGRTKITEYGLRNVEGLYNYIQNKMQTTGMSEEYIRKQIALVEKDAKNIWEQYKIYKKAKEEIKAYGDTIDNLEKRIPVGGLDFLTPDPKKGKERLDKSKDYFWDWYNSAVALLEDEKTREIYTLTATYVKRIEILEKTLKEETNLTKSQRDLLQSEIKNLEDKFLEERRKAYLEYYKKTWNEIVSTYYEEVVEEILTEDESISARYEKLLSKVSSTMLEQRAKINNALLAKDYFLIRREAKDFKASAIEKLGIEKEYQQELLKMRFDSGELTEDQYKIELNNIEQNYVKSLERMHKKTRGKFSIWNVIFGEDSVDEYGNVSRSLSAEMQNFTKNIETAFSSSFKFMEEWMDKRIEMAEIAVEAAEREAEATKTALEYEMEARANGYANNVELARKEYEEKLKLQKEAEREAKRLQKIQDDINSAQQMGSLLSATANIWASLTFNNPLGVALATAATSTMWGSFIAAKAQAAKVTKYGDGMSEYIDYGGSHASGNDVDFGVSKNGTRRRIERGEIVGVINKRNVDKYGVNNVRDIIDSLNSGTFDSKYSSIVDSCSPEMNASLYELAFAGLEGKTDLSVVESSLKTLVQQGETRVVSTPNGRIEYRGNNKRIIKN